MGSTKRKQKPKITENGLMLKDKKDGRVWVPTELETKIIEFFLNPENKGITQKDAAKIIGCHYNSVTNVLNKPQVTEIMRDIAMSEVRSAIGPILRATTKFAIQNAHSYADRRMLLEMLGVYQNQKNININERSVNIDVQLSKAPQEDLVKALRDYLSENPGLSAELADVQVMDTDENSSDESSEEYEAEFTKEE